MRVIRVIFALLPPFFRNRYPRYRRPARSVCYPHSAATPQKKMPAVGTDFDSPVTWPTPGSTESTASWPDVDEAVGPKASQPSPPIGGNAGVALRGLSLGPAANGPIALSLDFYTIRGPSQPAWREGGEKTLRDTRFDWKKNVTHCFLRCLHSLCSVLCAPPMLLKAVACVVCAFRVMYVPVSVPPNVPLEALQPVFRVFRVYCVSHHCYQHHFSAL